MKKYFNAKATLALMQATGADKRISDLHVSIYTLIGLANALMEEGEELAVTYGIHRQDAKPLYAKAVRAVEEYLSYIGRGIAVNNTISDFERLQRAFFNEFGEIPQDWEPESITRQQLTEIENLHKITFSNLPCQIIEDSNGD